MLTLTSMTIDHGSFEEIDVRERQLAHCQKCSPFSAPADFGRLNFPTGNKESLDLRTFGHSMEQYSENRWQNEDVDELDHC